MNVSTEIDESVLINNTAENFQALCTLLYPRVDPSSHRNCDLFIRINLLTDAAFYSTGELKQPIISIDLLMQLWILPTYEAKVVFLVENTTINDNIPWKKIYEQILRDSM